MALVQCNECGSMVSEKSKVCMKCGNPVSEILEEIHEKKKRKKKKLLKIACIVVVVILFCIVVAFMLLSLRAGKNKFYADIEWGSDYDADMLKLREIYKDDAFINNDSDETFVATVEDYMGDKGVGAIISYGYTDKKLTEVTIFVSVSDDSILTTEQLSKKYEEMFVKQFGEKDKEQESSYKKVWTLDECTASISNVLDGLVAIEFTTVKE